LGKLILEDACRLEFVAEYTLSCAVLFCKLGIQAA
jgi:hypothetical protein